MAGRAATWEDFIQGELLCTGLVSGVAMISYQGECVYSFGSLAADTPADTWLQFRGIFERATEKHDKKICNSTFTLPIKGEDQVFRVVRKTLSSLYGTSGGGCNGLVVCNVAYGVLICAHRKPECAGRIISAVEQFANLLRT